MYYRGMVLKKIRPKVHELRVYIGYGKAGAKVRAAIIKDAETLGLKLSKYVKIALKYRYQNLPL